MISISRLLSYASSYEETAFIKIAIIKKLPSGKWTVKSMKGKNLGEYDTKQEAVKNLRRIEWFKAHPKKNRKKKAADESSYSATMRELVKSKDDDAVREFQEKFKKQFDDALLAGDESPETSALKKMLQSSEKIALQQYAIKKTAEAIAMGDPKFAGKYLANLVRWLLQRISADRRPKSIESMKKKIYYLNEYAIAAKRMPASSSMGQAIVLLKNLLLNHSPQYIRAVLNSTVMSL